MCAASVTGLDEQFGVGSHKWHDHRDLGAVWQEEIRVFVEFFDDAEDIVPTAGVQGDDMVAQLIQNFIHLECSENGFYQYRHFDGAARNTKLVLCVAEDVIPELSLQMTLQLR